MLLDHPPFDMQAPMNVHSAVPHPHQRRSTAATPPPTPPTLKQSLRRSPPSTCLRLSDAVERPAAPITPARSPFRETGSSSPRTVVASYFEDLQLHGAGGGGGVSDGSIMTYGNATKSNLKRTNTHDDEDDDPPSRSSSRKRLRFKESIEEIPTSLPSPAPSPESEYRTPCVQPNTTQSEQQQHATPTHGRAKSPPPPAHNAGNRPMTTSLAESIPIEIRGTTSTDTNPSQAQPASTNNSVAATADSRDDEIDDGYGINGIGYRPTPAQSYARAEKRRQQIAAWRAREAREARDRRGAERRARKDADAAPPSSSGVGGGSEECTG